jgi:DNA-binding transcriptional LysR family regulator
MNFRLLEAFRAVMVAGSVTEACAVLGRSQPAVSRTIAELERELGYPLFERVNRRMVPTEEAMQLFEEVERSFTGLDRIREVAREIGGERRSRLRIISMPATSVSVLPIAAEAMTCDRPDINLSLEVRSSSWVVQSVLSRQSDVGIAGLPLDHPGLRIAFIAAAPCVCILHPRHPLTKRRRIRPRDLAGERFISLGANYRSRQRVDRIFREAGVERRLPLESQLSEMVCLLVARGLGVAIVDPFTPFLRPELGLETRPFDPEVIFEWGVFTQAGRPPSAPTQHFIGVLEKVVRGTRSPRAKVRRSRSA